LNEHHIYRFDFYHYIIATDCSTIHLSIDYVLEHYLEGLGTNLILILF